MPSQGHCLCSIIFMFLWPNIQLQHSVYLGLCSPSHFNPYSVNETTVYFQPWPTMVCQKSKANSQLWVTDHSFNLLEYCIFTQMWGFFFFCQRWNENKKQKTSAYTVCGNCKEKVAMMTQQSQRTSPLSKKVNAVRFYMLQSFEIY